MKRGGLFKAMPAYKKGDVLTFDKALGLKDCRVTRVRRGIVETEPLDLPNTAVIPTPRKPRKRRRTS